MTWSEFATVAMAIKTAWPSSQIMPTDDSKKVWYTMLSDLEYTVCENALKRLIATSKYPPSIAELRDACAECTSLPIVDAGDAWGEVQEAVRKFGYYRADEAMNSLKPLVRKAAERIGFREICLGDNTVANRAHFMKIYDAMAARQKNESRIPVKVLEQQRILQSLLDSKDERIEQKPIEPKEEEVPERASQEHIERLLEAFRKG